MSPRARIVVLVVGALVVMLCAVAWFRRKEVSAWAKAKRTPTPPPIVYDQVPVICPPGMRLMKTYPANLNDASEGLSGLRVTIDGEVAA